MLHSYSCQLVKAKQAAELRFTRRLRRTVPLTPSKGEADAQAVVVRELPAGQYLCRLLVDGQPVAAPQRVVVLPSIVAEAG